MIVYNNQSGLTNVYLGNTNIAKVYVGSNQVYPNSTPPTPYHFKAQYTNVDSTTGEVACNDSTTLSYTDFPSTTNLLHITVGECVDSFDTHLVSTNYSSLRTIDLTNSSMSSLPSSFMNGVSTLRGATLNPNTTTIGSSAFEGCTSLSAITIPSSITNINGNAFRNSGLREITYYSGITYGTYVYYNCSSASALTIEQGTTRIEQGTFAICSGLTSVDIPSSVTYIGTQAFSLCSNLSSITVNASTPPVLGSSVFSMTNECPIFVPCEAIEDYRTEWADYASRLQCIPTPTFDGKYKLTLNNGDVVSAACDGTNVLERKEISAYSETCVEAVVGDCVTTISNTAFGYFHNLSSVTISDSVVNIYGYAFAHCFSLTSIGDKGSGASIELPTGLTTIEGSTFEYCSGLTSVSIPSSITSIGYAAFGDCTSLQSIYIPSSVTSIEGYAFANCSGLTSIIVNATVPPSSNGATSNWYAFEGSTCQILVPCESINSYMSAPGWSSYASRIACIPTPPYYSQYFTTVAKEDGTIRFNRQNLNNLSYSLDSGATWSDGYRWNVNVTAGDKVMWKYDKTSPVSNYGIGSFTATCKFDVEGNIMSLYNGDDFVGKETIPNNAFKCLFSGATTLESAENLILPSTTSQACYESMFDRCTSLTTAPELPATILSYNCYNNMFTHCESLTTAPILSATTLVSGCYYGMFQVCKSLTSITCLATEILSEHTTDNWTYGVAQNGTFTKAQGMTWTTGSDGIPSGWTVQEIPTPS